MGFSYTAEKPKRLSLGNRIGILYKLKDVATSGSVIHTPFRKITGVLMSDLSPTTSCITWTTTLKTPTAAAKVRLTSNATAQGYCVVTGLL